MTRRRAARLVAIVLAVVLAAGVVLAGIVAVTLIRRPIPDRDQLVHLAGLGGPVSVLRDAQGVPQIYADNPDDLFRVQGYVQAEDQFFQMDVRRHITAGRLSELVGSNQDALQADAVVRTLGWRRVAGQEYAALDQTTRSYLQSYADGVNDYLRGRSPSQLSVSYSILGLAHPLAPIEQWGPVDSLAWLKAMAWDLRTNYEEELARARSFSTVRDVTRVDQLFPGYPYDQHATILNAGSAPTPEPHLTASTLQHRLNGSETSAAGTATSTGTSGSPATAAKTSAAGTATSTSTGSRVTGSPATAAKTSAAGTATSTGTSTSTSTGVTGSRSGAAARSSNSSRSGSDRATRPDPDGIVQAITSSAAQRALADTQSAVNAIPVLLGRGDDVGSNSWVVSGRLTASGKPLLANDPHLDTSIPGVWYQSGLHCRQVSSSCPFDVTGFGFAGMPGIVIGHNAEISWGLTNLGPDVSDFYLERVKDDQAEYDGAMRPLSIRVETIKVAGAADVKLTIRSTVHGPVLSDVSDDLARAGASSPVPGGRPDPSGAAGKLAVSLDWTALRPGHAMQAMFGLDQATDFAQFRAAALLLDVPAQNMVYADTAGNIGYQAPGRIPIRGPGRPDSPVPVNGTWPHPGWDSAYDWRGTQPLARLPWVENPPEGFVVAANQAVTGPSGSAFLTADWDYGYRSQRIRDLLTADVRSGRKVGVADMQAIQTDTRNGIAAVLVPLLLKTSVPDAFTQQAVNLLRGWDYSEPPDSAAAAYFNVVWANLLNLTFSDELPDGFRPDGGDRWFEVVRTLLDSPHNPWWDDRRTPDVVESRDEVLRRALSQARLQLTGTLGKDPSRWEWGRLHQLRLEQTPLGAAGVPWFVRALVDSGTYQAPGGSAIVDAFAWDASSGNFDVIAGPSMRMVVDLSNLDASRWVNQTGISGHPRDDHYTDQIGTWLAGGSYPWPFSQSAVQAASHTDQEFKASGSVG